MTDLLIWPPLLGVLGMVVAVIIYMIVRSYDPARRLFRKSQTLFMKAPWFS